MGLIGLWFVLSDVSITNPERGAAAFRAAAAPVEPVLLVATRLTTGWQWYLLTGGLEQETTLSRGAAALAVGIPLGVITLFGLA